MARGEGPFTGMKMDGLKGAVEWIGGRWNDAVTVSSILNLLSSLSLDLSIDWLLQMHDGQYQSSAHKLVIVRSFTRSQCYYMV